MKPFVFSADSHIMEPPSIFLDGLPASLKRHAIHSRKEGDFLITGTEDKVIYRLRVGQHREKALGDNERRGIREIAGRLEDMELGRRRRRKSASPAWACGSTHSTAPRQRPHRRGSTTIGTTSSWAATPAASCAAGCCRCSISRTRWPNWNTITDCP